MMACTEVWGGHGLTDQAVAMHGMDAWILARPYQRADAGGDVHLVSSCGTGRISRLLLADVSGHGVKVAPIAVQLRTLMRRYMNHVEQREFIERLNAAFESLTSSGVFATAVGVTYFAPTGALSITLAGHPRPLLFNNAINRWREMPAPPSSASSAGGTPPGLPLGVFGDTPYPPVEFRTTPGDLCVLYSDSLIEASRASGEMLGTEGLVKLMQGLDATEPERMASGLYNAVLDWAGTSELGDDVTVLVLRATGTSRGASLGERLWASVRFFGDIIRWPLGGRTPAWPEISVANIIGSIVPAAERHVGRGAMDV